MCDDDLCSLEISSDIGRKTPSIKRNETQIVRAASSGTQILQFFAKNPGIYLYFLDFDFGEGELNGVDLARLIKKQEARSKVVFVTSRAGQGMAILKIGGQGVWVY